MKKFAAVVAVAVLVAFAAPAFAAINPFMDVPMNHWAYDAIGQLAAHGILSGYPDGTYKGKQPTTRYEMASALARALAVVDMTKASKQDLQMLQRLVVEFRDELDALGVRVDELDERVSLIESRLGGWKISGHLRLDITEKDRDAPEASGSAGLSRARLNIERWFGDPENPMHFYARINDTHDVIYKDDKPETHPNWDKFYVDVPFFGGTTLTAGRFADDLGADYYMGGNWGLGVGDYSGFDSVLTDRNVNGLKITKNFGLGSFLAYLGHSDMYTVTGNRNEITARNLGAGKGFGAWELFMMGKFQFTEKFGFDIGLQAFAGDNAENVVPVYDEYDRFLWYDGYRFNNLWTLFAGFRVAPMEGITFKGIYYHQKLNAERYLLDTYAGRYDWYGREPEDANHWRIILDVSQDVLKYTSAWLEYGHVEEGFMTPTGSGAFFNGGVYLGGYTNLLTGRQFRGIMEGNVFLRDVNYYRIALGQQWTPKIGTYLFFYKYNVDADWYEPNFDFAHWGLGVTYKYNDNVKFGLNYSKVDYAEDESWYGAFADESIIRFRTDITF